MRIGTWNLDAKWTPAHAEMLNSFDCDIWLLTEVADGVALTDYAVHRCVARMSRGQHYAAVVSRLPMTTQPDPHRASASAKIDNTLVCASVLPWASKDDPEVWGEGTQGERTRRAVDTLATSLVAGRSVWGGDFNHALSGPTRWSGSTAGRTAILGLVRCLGLVVPTADLPHRLAGTHTIDQLAVPLEWVVIDASRQAVSATLSDHDIYLVATQTAAGATGPVARPDDAGADSTAGGCVVV